MFALRLETVAPQDLRNVRAWMNQYLMREHRELGRPGSVCPFVEPALRAEAVRWEKAEVDRWTLDGLRDVMVAQLDRFSSADRPTDKEGLACLVTVVDLPTGAMPLLDEAQRLAKPHAVRRGLMIGQFHPRCPEPAVWNPKFPVSRSPVPLFAIRHMAFHDILFLHADPVAFAEYDKRFGERYASTASRIPDAFAERYERAARLRKGTGQAYIDYQHLDLLHALQQPHTDHPAEMTFYLVGQAKELLFKLLVEEIATVRSALLSDRVEAAVWGLRRVCAGLQTLTKLWDVLRALSPAEFGAFREELGVASGIDSYMYRMVEFTLGYKREHLAERHAHLPGVAEQVYRALHGSSLYDEALALLHRRGMLPAAHDAAEVRRAWARLLRADDAADPLFRLAEGLMDVAEDFGRWRALHLLLVERTIGTVTGTAGTEGVDWLRGSADHRFFPELWQARTCLAERP
ncbi:tryptophan 2,3-dioxygenase family protein [Streptomyces sp. TRM70308]|uniref:tryptophan 2,3-dioxygenase n=1 Tax=Streptomyces sp. TRM70308 TaxID=3131932 RepID=UPI003D053A56